MKDDIFTIEHKGQTDEEKEKARIAKEEADKQRRINFGITFSTREGFDTLMEIMKFCHFSQISYVQGDQAETALLRFHHQGSAANAGFPDEEPGHPLS